MTNAKKKDDFYVVNYPGRDRFYPVHVPDGVSGDWRVRTDHLTRENTLMANLRALRDGNPELEVSPGDYKVLSHKGSCVMSNTQMEYRTNVGFVESAEGQVLVTGLGLGMILRPLLANAMVESITVVELSADVITLVAGTYSDLIEQGRLTIVKASATDWEPHKHTRFDCAWHDIWSDISSENLTQMAALVARYKRWVTGAQGCWSRELARREKRRYG